jgi:hypothetical protein
MKITDSVSLYDQLVEGFNRKQAKAVEAEKKKQGTWRGGSSGCITSRGKVIGADPRAVVLRYLGIQKPIDYDTDLMLQAGLASEDSFNELLDEAGVNYKCEEDIPMVRKLSNGDLVTGRPDAIILDENDQPTLGIELKLICSDNSAMNKALFARETVDSKHLVQSCHYAGFFNVPWSLVYTSRVIYPIPFYARKNEEKWFAYPEHRAIRRDDKGEAFQFKPFQSLYDIELADDGDTFLLNGQETVITKSGIDKFYEYCAECVATKTIPRKRSGGIDHWGDATKKNKTIQFDDFKEARTDSWDNWIADCKKISGQTD